MKTYPTKFLVQCKCGKFIATYPNKNKELVFLANKNTKIFCSNCGELVEIKDHLIARKLNGNPLEGEKK